jgi:co-chaperonin GroES (HSP10)
MLKIKPFFTRVLILLDKPVDKTYGESKIIIQVDKNVEHMDTGTIVDMGPLAFSDMRDDQGNTPVRIGDKVAFNRYEGKKISDPDNLDTHYRVMNDLEIWAGVTNE